MPDGSTLNVDFNISLTVLSLKSRILSIISSLPPTIQLFYSGKILKDDRTLESYSIQAKSVLSLLIKQPLIQIIVLKLGGYLYTIDIERNFTIAKIKQRISKKSGIPEIHQKLIFRNKVLDDDDCVARDLDIDDKSVLNLMISEKIRIVVSWKENQRELSLILYGTDHIESVKSKIFKEFLVDKDQQVLIWQGKKLVNDKSLNDYNIGNGSVLNFMVHKTIQVLISIEKDVVKTLDVLLSMTLMELKRLIEEKFDLEVGNLLYYDNILNEENKTLFEYGLVNFSQIEIFNDILNDSRFNSNIEKIIPLNVVKDNSDSILIEN